MEQLDKEVIEELSEPAKQPGVYILIKKII